ncbi:MAG: ABC transporter ATP-binding protein [Spirochaetaceae bacterium]|jgi:iron complex transport system ATP-binding protein|nr:ABC transporter ATP-binding protein [Spirochaetaceae bacterium]
MSEELLRCEGVFAGYGGAPVVRDISLSVCAGDMLCIAGPNGSGKSTLLKAVAAILPYGGSITIDGKEARHLPRRELGKRVALLNQLSRVYFPYTVYETVALSRYAYASGFFKTSSKEDGKIVQSVLAELELDSLRDVMLDELSGGQLQRVYLARAIAQDPDIILLDEPTNHLDLKYQIELLRYLQGWVHGRRKAVVGVMHDLNLALTFFDNAFLMSAGKTAAAGLSTGEPSYTGGTRALFTGGSLNAVYGIDVPAFMRQSLANWG